MHSTVDYYSSHVGKGIFYQVFKKPPKRLSVSDRHDQSSHGDTTIEPAFSCHVLPSSSQRECM